MNRMVGQVRRDGIVVKRVYGKKGVGRYGGAERAVESKRLRALIEPYLELPDELDPRQSLRDALDAYASRKERGGRAISPATRFSYSKAIKKLDPRFCAMRVVEVKSADVEHAIVSIKMVRGKTNGARTRQLAYKLLRAVFDKAKNQGLIAVNPVRATEAPYYRRQEKARVFTPSEQNFILKANAMPTAQGGQGDAYDAMLRLGLTMPVRPCELFALRRCDLNIAARKAHITHDLTATPESKWKPVLGPVKTPESDRYITLAPKVVAAITRLLEATWPSPESLVFTAPGGAAIRHSNLVRKWWGPLLEKAAELAEKAARDAGDPDYRFPKEAGLYSLRHTAIENLKAIGVPEDVIKVLAGHTSLRTTHEHYNQPTDARKLEAANAVGDWLFRDSGQETVAVG